MNWLQTRLYAALTHGEFTNVYLFSEYMEGGANAIVEVLHRWGLQFKACTVFVKRNKVKVLTLLIDFAIQDFDFLYKEEQKTSVDLVSAA